ncbi:hypothetical protein P9112_000008 [Eukaryota sp. TZLM1-RC]
MRIDLRCVTQPPFVVFIEMGFQPTGCYTRFIRWLSFNVTTKITSGYSLLMGCKSGIVDAIVFTTNEAYTPLKTATKTRPSSNFNPRSHPSIEGEIDENLCNTRSSQPLHRAFSNQKDSSRDVSYCYPSVYHMSNSLSNTSPSLQQLLLNSNFADTFGDSKI